jgi:hypothetical protein
MARDFQPARRIRSVSPALGKPLVGESVTELTRVQVRQASLAAAAPKHLDQAPGGQAAFEPQPQPWQGRVLVPGSHTWVSIEGDRRRVPERQGTFPAALAQDERDVQVAGHGAVGEVLGPQCRSKEWLRLKGPPLSMAGP